jgi:hypothetical protein
VVRSAVTVIVSPVAAQVFGSLYQCIGCSYR